MRYFKLAWVMETPHPPGLVSDFLIQNFAVANVRSCTHISTLVLLFSVHFVIHVWHFVSR